MPTCYDSECVDASDSFTLDKISVWVIKFNQSTIVVCMRDDNQCIVV